VKIKSIVLRGGKKDVTFVGADGKDVNKSFPANTTTAQIQKTLDGKSAKPDSPKKTEN
jgi:hypothetical protein